MYRPQIFPPCSPSLLSYSHPSSLPLPAPPGLDNGNIRVYEWPLNGSFVEYPCHKGPVSGLRVSFDHTRLLSTSEDGALMTFALQRYDFPSRFMNNWQKCSGVFSCFMKEVIQPRDNNCIIR